MKDDLISRQAAIDEIGEWIKAFLENGHKESAADARLIQDGIIQLPSAQPERKKGSWNVIQGNIVVCSECGMLAPKSMTGCLLNRHLEPNRTNLLPELWRRHAR